MKKGFYVCLIILFMVAFLFAGEKRKITVDDCLKIEEISDVQISPEGERIVFVKSGIISSKGEKDTLKRTSDIFMVTLADNEVHRLTTHEKGSTYPRWSPDGRYLAFLSERTEKNQIWMLDMERGGEAQQLTDWKSEIKEFAWPPDSNRIAFVSEDPAEGEEGTDSGKTKKNDPYVITRTNYLFDGIGYYGDPRAYRHIWIIDLKDPKNPVKVTDGPFDDGNIFWSPDGSQIGFVSNRTGDDDDNDNTDIWVVPSQGGEVRQITTNIGSDGSIQWYPETYACWSPDGKFIAYNMTPEPNNIYKLIRLCVIPAGGGEPRCLSDGFDRDVVNIVWGRNSQFVYGLVPDKARVHVYRFSIKDGEATKILGGENRKYQLALSSNNNYFAFVSEDNNHPHDIYTASVDGNNLTQRTRANKGLMEEVQLGETERIQYENPDGQTAEGFVLKPPDFDPDKKYPLILKIHGGPQGTDGNYFAAEGQWYAANGYIVLWVNYRGSSDYGQEWQEAIAVNWYFKEYDDLMAAVDYMCQKDYVDPKRLGVTGVSYGGIMTTWIVGFTDRFAAAVAERFVVDNFSSFGVDDCTSIWEKDLGLPYEEENFTLYRKLSPISYIKNCTTPILLMQCMEDQRCPFPQALQFYMGLKKLKKAEVQLVLYPRESHGIEEIPHQADRLQRIVNWFDKYLKK